jgi:drug/metabolite transporter (DMT)-like permease
VTANRRTILTTTTGTNRGAFGPREWGLFMLAGAGFGSAFMFIAVALSSMRPGYITLFRAGSAALALLAIPKARRPIDREDWPRLLVLAMFLVVIPLTLVPIAQQWIDSAVTGMLGGAMPIMATVIASLMLRAWPTTYQASGVVLGFAGVVLVGLRSVGESTMASLGVTLVLVATGCYALALNIAAPLQRRYGSLPVMSRSMSIAAVLTAPYAVLTGSGSTFEVRAVAAILTVGVVGTALASVALGALIGRAGASRAASVAYLVPLVSLGLGVAVRGETVTVVEVAGIAVILIGALLTSRSEVPHPAGHLE